MENIESKVKNAFPDCLPTDEVVNDSVTRLEDGWEVLEILSDTKWSDFDLTILSKVSGEYYQLSIPWQRYFLPAFIILGEKLDVKNENDTDAYDAAFSYSVPIKDLNLREGLNTTNNVFIGPTNTQLDLVATWMSNMQEKLPEIFDFKDEELAAAIQQAKTS